ncbi:MAG: NAD(P)-dependent oxidoreductase [Woeseia sp.]
MKALLHFRASEALGAQILRQLPAWLRLSIADPEDEDLVRKHLADTEVLFHVLAPADKVLMAQAPRLRFIQKIGVGVNTIDLAEARRRGILVANMPGTNSQAVAEMALALILAAIRKISRFDFATRSGQGWALPPDVMDDVTEIAGKVVGLVGFGAVPRRLAPVLKAMGAKVVYSDPHVGTNCDAESVATDVLIREADIISLHVPLTPETRGMIGRPQLEQMRKGVILINTARGELVDENALSEFLQSRHVRCAALDVFANEPADCENPLFKFPNVLVTPHIAWLTAETIERSLVVAIENCRLLRNNLSLVNQVFV